MSGAETVLACIGADASGAGVVELASRLAKAVGARWIALYVETPDLARLPLAAREQVLAVLQRAEDLGAETFTLGSVDVAHTILGFARSRAVTSLVVGKPKRRAWLPSRARSTVAALVADSGSLTVHIAGEQGDGGGTQAGARVPPFRLDVPKRNRAMRYAAALALVLAGGALGFGLQRFLPSASVVMLYLLAVMLAGLYLGKGPAVFTAIGSGLSFNYLFTEPQLTLNIYDLSEVVNFAALVTVGLVVAELSARARHQARVAVQREERAVSLAAFTASLLSAQTVRDISDVACEHIGRSFDATVDLWLCTSEGTDMQCTSDRRVRSADARLLRDACERAHAAGASAGNYSGDSYYMPVVGADRAVGVLVIEPRVPKRLLLPEPRKALQGFAHQLALALERMEFLRQKRAAEIAVRAEDLRNDLLAGLSHDLRTPLASILGSSSALVEGSGALNESSRTELVETIHEDALRMTRLVTNLLEMARLTQGFSRLKREWIPLEELIGSVRHRLAPLLASRPVSVRLAQDLPFAYVDGLLFEQVLQNLLENAVKYSPAGAPVEISAALDEQDGRRLRVDIADRGIGVPPDSREAIFDKFQRAHPECGQSGAGLGLALCKSIVLLHGGSIGVESRAGGGSIFRITLPVVEPEHEAIEEASPP